MYPLYLMYVSTCSKTLLSVTSLPKISGKYFTRLKNFISGLCSNLQIFIEFSIGDEPRFAKKSLIPLSTLTLFLLNTRISLFICKSLSSTLRYWSSFNSPAEYPKEDSRMSALSGLSNNLYSDLEVYILQGSKSSLVIRSSIKTPIQLLLLLRIRGSLPDNFKAVFTPAIKPCAAASSYPEVPLICPAKKRFSTDLHSSECFNWFGNR